MDGFIDILKGIQSVVWGTDYPDFIGGNGIIFYNTFGVFADYKIA